MLNPDESKSFSQDPVVLRLEGISLTASGQEDRDFWKKVMGFSTISRRKSLEFRFGWDFSWDLKEILMEFEWAFQEIIMG